MQRQLELYERTAGNAHHSATGLWDDGFELRVVYLDCCAAICELNLRHLHMYRPRMFCSVMACNILSLYLPLAVRQC